MPGRIPQFMPGTIPHRVQSPISSPQMITAEQLDSHNYGPDITKFFGHGSESGNCYKVLKT